MKVTKDVQFYELHSSQLEVFYDQLLDEDSPHYNVGGYVILKGKLRYEKLIKAIKTALGALDIHQMSFDIAGSRPLCFFRKGISDIDILELDFSTHSNPGKAAANWMQERYNIAFNLKDEALYEFAVLHLADEENIMYCKYHHLLTDAFGFTISLKSVAEKYNSLVLGEEDTQVQYNRYKDELTENHQYLISERFQRDHDYWADRFREIPNPVLLKKYAGGIKQKNKTLIFDLSESRRKYYAGLFDSTGISIQQLTILALHIYFGSIAENNDCTFGVEVYKRRKQQWNTAGMFAGILPFKVSYQQHETVYDLAMKIRKQLLSDYRHQHYPVSHLNRELKLFKNNREQLFEIYVNYLLLDFDLFFTGLNCNTYELLSEFEKVPLRFWWRDYGKQQGLQLRIDYDSEYLNDIETPQLIERILALMDRLGENMHNPISQVRIITDEEERGLMFTGRGERVVLPTDKMILRLFGEQVKMRPQQVAAIGSEKKITYKELDEAAARLAGFIASQGVTKGSIVAVCLERSVELLVCILGIWKAGAIYLPVEPDYPAGRIRYILDNSNASIVITNDCYKHHFADSNNCQLIFLDTQWQQIQASKAVAMEADAAPDSLAYIIYTSGSTGEPKGVMIEHKGMLNHLFAKINELQLNDKSKVLQNASASFDISVWQFFAALLKGGTVIIYTQQIILDTSSFLSGIAADGLTHVEVVPSYLRALLEDPNHKDLKLPELKYLLVTGEAVHKNIIAAWFNRFPDIAMVNAYGPTEASDDITHYNMTTVPDLEQIPIGFPVQNMDIYVFTPHCKLCPAGVPGEIGVAGIGVGRGYLNNPALSAEKFIDNPFDKEGPYKLYRTGDIGYWTADGKLVFIGRIDDQVKIRGHRIELGEIETAFMKYPGIQQAVVVPCDDVNKIKRLVAYIVRLKDYNYDGLQPFLKTILPEYMVPSIITELSEIPLTSNGKIDRKALPVVDVTAIITNEYQAPGNDMEKQLAGIWERILQVEKIGRTDNFFGLGGDSLHAAQLIASIRKELNTEIAIKDLFNAPTIAGLSLAISAKSNISLPQIKTVKRPAKIPLSYSQERLWFIDQLQGSLNYQVPVLLRINGHLDKTRLEQAFKTIVNRHEALRTVFKEDEDGVPYQHILPEHQWKLTFTDEYAGGNTGGLKLYIDNSLAQPIDLSGDYMIRVTLIKLNRQEHLLLIVMHHIASDGWSMPLYLNELKELYLSGIGNRKPLLTTLPVQYADYAIWQRSEVNETLLENKLMFWEKQLAGVEPLNLPADFSRPAVQSINGNTLNFSIGKELHESLKSLARQEGVTMYMLMLSVFKILLYRYTGQTDICVGSPVANRSHKEIEPLIGFFVNTIAIRNDLGGNPTLRDLLKRVKNASLEAFSNQDVPFDKIVNRISANKDMRRSPVFQVMFNLENNPDISNIELADLKISAEPVLYALTKFELTFQIGETPNGLTVDIEYCTDLFAEETIRRMMKHFTKLLSSSVANPAAKISNIAMLLPEEEKQLIETFNDTRADYRKDKTVADLFREIADRTPDNIAVEYEGKILTYGELNKRSDEIAHFLIQKKAGNKNVIAICIDRSVEMVIGLLAIMKSGCAYVPVDPAHPLERINHIIDDSGANLIISDESCSHLIEPKAKREIVLVGKTLPSYESDLSIADKADLPAPSQTEGIVYVIYTSGSTGIPKGVMVKHQSLLNFLFYMINKLQFTPASDLLAVTTYSFDISYLEIYMPLITGGKIILTDSGSAADGFLLKSLLSKHRPAFMQATPATWQLLMDAGWTNEEKTVILTGGEAIREGLKEYLVSLSEKKVWNLYGPTETTIWSTIEELKAGKKITIGLPIANTQVYISNNIIPGNPISLAPFGVTGELLIGGDGLAKGYWGKPELTAERFIDNPFGSEDNQLLYRTGDLARRLPDGRIECLGRNDSQVKIRGYRIELEEIESVVLQHEQIKKCAVLAKDDAAGQMSLIAYIVADHKYKKNELLIFLKSKLPAYMVPAVIIEITDMPLNPNGKVDRKALPNPEITDLRTTEYAAPRNETEEKLVAIWQELLHVKEVGVFDNFFELGGHSLLATRVMASCRKEFEVNVPLRILFDFTCIADLANYIRVVKTDTEAEQEFEIMAL